MESYVILDFLRKGQDFLTMVAKDIIFMNNDEGEGDSYFWRMRFDLFKAHQQYITGKEPERMLEKYT